MSRIVVLACTRLLSFGGCRDGVLVRGAKDKGDVRKGDALKEAYELGAAIE